MQVLKRISSRSVALLLSIMAVAALLSLVSYQFSEYTAKKIQEKTLGISEKN